jgi:hypothetical protein
LNKIIGASLVVALLAFASAAQASVTISTSATSNMNCSAGVCSPTAKKAVLNVTDLANMLATEDVKITTGNGVVTISVFAPFSWTSKHRLTLDANYNVTFQAPVTVAGRGAVSIVTNDGGTGGDLIFFPGAKLDFWDLSSSLRINGAAFTVVADIHTLAAAIAANPSGYYALVSDYDAASDGKYLESPIAQKFSGTFTGLNHVIANLRIVGSNASQDLRYVGLFSECAPECQLEYLRLKDAHVNVRRSNFSVGIIAGANLGTILHTSSSGFVEAGDLHHHRPRFLHVGGLVGRNRGVISLSNSSAAVKAIGIVSVAGGIAGFNGGRISESFATGESFVSGAHGVWAEGGGLVGRDEGQIDHCYATGAVKADAYSFVGGLVGATHPASIDQAYSIGSVAGGRYAGGFVGYDYGSGNFTSTFWNLDTSGITDPSQGAGNVENDPGITGLTEAQLKSGLPPGFDRMVWGHKKNINNGYPYLLANPPPQ